MKKLFMLLLTMFLTFATAAAEQTVDVYTGEATDLAPWTQSASEKILGVSYGNRGELENAYMKDVIKISFTMKEGESLLYEIRLADPDGWKDMDGTRSNPTYASGPQTYTYTISNVSYLDVIQKRGIIIRGNNVTITKVELTKVDDRYNALPIVIGAAGMATWSSNQHHKVIGDNVTVYYASSANVGSVTLTPITETGKENTIWSYQGYIIKGPKGVYEAKVIEESGAYWPSNNLLVGADGGAKVFKSKFTNYTFTEGDFWYSDETDKATKENIIKTKYRYIFAQEESNDPAFYKLAENYSRSKDETTVYYHDLGAHKAYLQTDEDITPTTPGAPAIHLVFDEENGATTVEQFEANDEVQKFIENGQLFIRKNGITYDLMGRTVK